MCGLKSTFSWNSCQMGSYVLTSESLVVIFEGYQLVIGMDTFKKDSFICPNLVLALGTFVLLLILVWSKTD